MRVVVTGRTAEIETMRTAWIWASALALAWAAAVIAMPWRMVTGPVDGRRLAVSLPPEIGVEVWHQGNGDGRLDRLVMPECLDR